MQDFLSSEEKNGDGVRGGADFDDVTMIISTIIFGRGVNTSGEYCWG